jgi:hypothetical protein
MSFLKINWDALGIGASLACAIHCAVLPLLYTTFPLFGVNIIHNPFFEWFMILLALAIGINALWHGFLKHHHSKWPVTLLVTGFTFLIAKEWLPGYHTLMVVIAVAFIVSAHFLNYRLCRVANHCHKDDCNH